MNKDDLSFLELQYQVLSNRQVNHNTLVWGSPSLLFVAQAVLWDLSLRSDISLLIRCCISFFSILAGYASIQLFIRSRLMEIADSEQLFAIEKCIMEQKQIPVLVVHQEYIKRTIYSNGHFFNLSSILKQKDFYRSNFSSRFRTFYVWKFVLWVSLIPAVVIFGYNIYFVCLKYGIFDLLSLMPAA